MSIPTGIDLFTGGHLIRDSGRNKFMLGGVGLVISLISYYLLVHGGKYKQIAQEFSHESPRQKKTRLIVVWIYMLGSFVLFFTLLALRDA